MGLEGFRERSNIERLDLGKVTEKVKNLYLELANTHLNDGDPLKEKIVSYYSDTPRLQKELAVVFKGLTGQEINSKIEEVAEKLSDKTLFVEHYQKIFERIDTKHNMLRRMQENPEATDEEYELGTYKEGVEQQVRDACFALNRKGYKTFESGFREKDGDRDQYIGMYNYNVELPASLIESFKEKQFDISIIREDDRTVINIHPERAEPVTLTEWKQLWDELAERLPVASPEDFSGVKAYKLHTEFREKQDALRAQRIR